MADVISVDLAKAKPSLVNWLVASSLPNNGISPTHVWLSTGDGEHEFLIPDYCGDWSIGGPLSEQHRVSSQKKHDGWWLACIYGLNDEPECGYQIDHSRLLAEMRCLVASIRGTKINVPTSVYDYFQIEGN